MEAQYYRCWIFHLTGIHQCSRQQICLKGKQLRLLLNCRSEVQIFWRRGAFYKKLRCQTSGGPWLGSSKSAGSLLAAAAFANHSNCVGLARSISHHRNTRGLKIVACALMCRGTQKWERSLQSLAPCWWQFNSKLFMENSVACLDFHRGVCIGWKHVDICRSVS